MCYDVSFTVDLKELADYFPDMIVDGQLELNFDTTHIIGHSYNNHPILFRNREDGTLHCRMMEWGCIPFYVQDMKTFSKQRPTMLNARSERILGDSKSYWYKIRNRRCLIPLNGIYEHRSVAPFKHKIPYFIKPKGQRIFYLPGLYSVTELPDVETGEVIKRWSYTLITRSANDLMKVIHNDGDNKWRMPLFLPEELAKRWLVNELKPEEYKLLLDFEMPSEELEAWTVFTVRSTKPRPDGLAKNQPFQWEGIPVNPEIAA
ncbi:MAG: SOS response-associated peptidase family protein [Chitinophagaceae bacterium]